MSDYKPGTVAVATVRGVPNVRVFLAASNTWVSGTRVEGCDLHRVNHEVTDVRPLAVLDLDASGMGGPQRIANYLRACAPVVQEHGGGMWAGHLDRIADQIEQQTKPPKPAEPTGLGAVVEDGNGKRWTRYDAQGDPQPWWCDGAGPDIPVERRFAYADIDAVRVLSDGVTA